MFKYAHFERIHSHISSDTLRQSDIDNFCILSSYDVTDSCERNHMDCVNWLNEAQEGNMIRCRESKERFATDGQDKQAAAVSPATML